MKTIVTYIRDFSIVVAGIAVTLYVNDIVTNQGEKRDLKLYLNTIIMELEENKKEMNNVLDYLQPSADYAEYLSSHHRDSLSRDTLKIYEKVFTAAQVFTFNTNAFEMFKSSGVMRLVEDKELLLLIWNTYSSINDLKYLLDMSFDMKREALTDLIALAKQGEKINAPMYDYFTDVNVTQTSLRDCIETLETIDKLIAELSK